MRKLYIDCSSGVSGDMMLGAFLDLGVPLPHLSRSLDSLGLDEFHLAVKHRKSCGFEATDVDVVLSRPEDLCTAPYGGRHRNYGDIKRIIEGSAITDGAKALSRKIFDIKAGAEAKVHGVSADEVQFHEAGAVDSIVDIVGTAICFDYLGIDEVLSKKVPTGYGEVKCACGVLPVPAPAVRQILADSEVPHYRSDIPQEVLTPTGASIIAGLTDSYGWDKIEEKEETEALCGFGTGKRDTGLPPLKIILCEKSEVEKNV